MFKALHLKRLQTKRGKFKAIQGQTKPTEHEEFVGFFPPCCGVHFAEDPGPTCMHYYMLIYYTQLFWVFENHVIGRCQGLFPPILSSAEKSPGNEVGGGGVGNLGFKYIKH